jgi:hypothetical protein
MFDDSSSNAISLQILFVDAALVPLIEEIAPDIDKTVEKFIILGHKKEMKTSLKRIFFYENLMSQGDGEIESL